MKRFYWLVFCFISPSLLAQVYSTSVTDSRWHLQAGPFSCRLSHKIDGFGQWVISRKPGQSEKVSLKIDKGLQQTKNLSLPAGTYKLLTAPPAWRPQDAAEVVGELQQATANADLSVPQTLLPGIYALLGQNTPVVISYQGQPLRIQLQPYQFKESYKKYKNCVAQLIPYTFEQILRTTLYYQVEDTGLSSANRQALDKILRYAKADPARIVSVLVDGHSDTQNDEGLADQLSKTHAELVAAYLKEKGIGEDKIRVRSHGDKYPVASNALAKEKAKNRRVTVRLEDASIQQKNAKKIAERKKREEAKAAASSSVSSSESSQSSVHDFGDKLPIELELERMAEDQDLEKPSASELPSP